MGGENGYTPGRDIYHFGSSPRGRGKLHADRPDATARRLIPAWAGKTLSACRRANRRWAHPRVGGENVVTQVPVGTPPGSSPRGRGKLIAVDLDTMRERLIPAWAGKTRSRSATPWGSPAHPRVGGENLVQ